jgi:hypothetical protein
VDNDDPDLASGIFGDGDTKIGAGLSRTRTGPNFTAEPGVHAMNTTHKIFRN